MATHCAHLHVHADAESPAAQPQGRASRGVRIVIGADTFPPDVNDSANFTHRLAVGLASRGNEVHVICPSTDRRSRTLHDNGITVHGLPSVRGRTWRFCPPWRLSRMVPALLRALAPDVVHVQSHVLIGRYLSRHAALQKVPLVATTHVTPENLHGLLSRLAWRDLVRVFGLAELVTAPTPHVARLLSDNGLARPVRAISNGIDLSRYTHGPDEGRADAPTVLFVGRLDRSANVHELLQAVALLPERICPAVDLVGDGSERSRLRQLADELGLGERVRFHGVVSDEELVRTYRRCHVFCMPGTAELQSTATMEAMAAGKPVVAAHAMALPHLVSPGVNGWLYQPGDVRELAARLADVLCRDVIRDRLGAASRKLIARHGIDTTLGEFESVYRSVTGIAARTDAE